MEKGKVSIVLPCYNRADTIERAVHGVIKQTYRPIQLILINDGSTDRTENVVLSMLQELQEAQIEFKYIWQENMGPGGAVNTGLKYVDGEYMAWVDSDDELMPESVAIRVDFLEKNQRFGSVCSNAVTAEDRDWSRSLGKITENIQLNSEEDQFEHILMVRSIICCGCHLVRTEVFRKANGGMDIYPSRYAQNLQILLPVNYASKRAFLDIPLYKYRISEDSLEGIARRMTTRELAKRRQAHADIIKHTLDRITDMPIEEKKKYLRMYKKRIYEQNLDTAIEQKSKVEALRWRITVMLMNRIPWLG